MREKTAHDLFASHVRDLYPLAEPGFTLRYIGQRREEGRSIAEVEVNAKRGGVKVVLGFDRKTGLMCTTRAEEVLGGKKRFAKSVIVSYQQVEGVKIPRTTKDYVNGRLESESTYERLVPGSVDPAVFEPPR